MMRGFVRVHGRSALRLGLARPWLAGNAYAGHEG